MLTLALIIWACIEYKWGSRQRAKYVAIAAVVVATISWLAQIIIINSL